MTAARIATGALSGILMLAACDRKSDATVTLSEDRTSPAAKRDEPPVPLNPTPPVEYPEALYRRRIGGTVLLRLFVNEQGKVAAESTRIQESSGYPALDSAALGAAKGLKYAPALRDGVPVAEAFLQPVRFRHPDGGGLTP